MTSQIGIVDYLELLPQPSLRVDVCDACSARYLGRRASCGNCGGEAFHRDLAPDTGILRSFTIVYRAAPGVPVPFIASIIELDDGTYVSANLIGIEPDPALITLGGPVVMTTFVAGTDTEGTEAIAFAYEPVTRAEVGVER